MKNILKNIFISVFICILLCSCGEKNVPQSSVTYPERITKIADIDSGDVIIDFRAYDKSFYRCIDNEWQIEYISGVNIGLSEPLTDLSSPDTSYETYVQWLSQISEMNANCVRVFSVMPPQFYQAFYDFNQGEKKLFLMHGIWFNEEYMISPGDAYSDNEIVVSSLKRAAKETIDIIHGNSNYTSYGDIENAVYDWDISQYTMGYIMGLEWSADFIENTNHYSDKSAYSGKYLYTDSNASAFEAFLCRCGDYLIEYETDMYHHQIPVSFLNWASTDPLVHTNEPFDEEDSQQFNPNMIIATQKYFCGMFASYDAYPYYPEFMNYQPEYVEYVDQDGKKNPYRAYLNDLVGQSKMPVLIAEYGLPTSRGVAHVSATGYNQGGLTERQQGEYVAAMAKDIAMSQCAGGLVFSWQDEWFKQTWNTVKYAPDNAHRRTPNVMSAEQCYGILSYEAGKQKACKIDGKFGEWSETGAVFSQNGNSVYLKYDEAYLYVYLDMNTSYDFDSDTVYLPISTLGLGSNFCVKSNTMFSHNSDFLICINGMENTRITVDSYYDSYYYIYGIQRQAIGQNMPDKKPDSGEYNNINMFLSNEMMLPETGEIIDFSSREIGKLKYANEDEYDMQADFFEKDGKIELRIAWYLLNILNPAQQIAIGDLYENGGIEYEKVKDIYIGAGLEGEKINMFSGGYDGIDNVSYYSRLKKSYNIISKRFNEINKHINS